jgi:hypothetical protein
VPHQAANRGRTLARTKTPGAARAGTTAGRPAGSGPGPRPHRPTGPPGRCRADPATPTPRGPRRSAHWATRVVLPSPGGATRHTTGSVAAASRSTRVVRATIPGRVQGRVQLGRRALQAPPRPGGRIGPPRCRTRRSELGLHPDEATHPPALLQRHGPTDPNQRATGTTAETCATSPKPGDAPDPHHREHGLERAETQLKKAKAVDEAPLGGAHHRGRHQRRGCRDAGGAPQRPGRRLLQRRRPRLGRVRRAGDGVLGAARVHRVPRLRDLRRRQGGRGGGGAHGGPAGRDGPVPPARGRRGADRRAGLLRALGRPPGVATDGDRHPRRGDQPLGRRAVPDDQDRSARDRERGGRLRQVARPDLRQGAGPDRPRPWRPRGGPGAAGTSDPAPCDASGGSRAP